MLPERETLPRQGLERLCLEIFRALPGLEETTAVVVMATRHLYGASWDVLRIFPAPLSGASEGAEAVIARLQEAFDLRVEH
jgi:hypothetical protein